MSEFTYRLALRTFRAEPFNKFSNKFWNCLQEKMKNYTFWTILYFVFSNGMVEKMRSYIGCICFGFYPLCILKWVLKLPRMHSHIIHIGSTFLHCVFSNVYSNLLLRGLKVTLLAFVWCFSTLCFQMSSQRIRGKKVTVFAFVWVYPSVYFHMCPQGACIKECNITLLAFIWLFTSNYLHLTIHSHTGYICLTFLFCVFSNESSNR